MEFLEKNSSGYPGSVLSGISGRNPSRILEENPSTIPGGILSCSAGRIPSWDVLEESEESSGVIPWCISEASPVRVLGGIYRRFPRKFLKSLKESLQEPLNEFQRIIDLLYDN